MVRSVDVKIWYDNEEDLWVATVIVTSGSYVTSVEKLFFKSKEEAMSYAFDLCRKMRSMKLRCNISAPEIVMPMEA
ncbi:MAG: hypothetical protein J7L07_05805 [Candidatus Odinarchaeota archaeon]|nr:hypothetical protein [Candidatus Odinarchaeota archaeon]